MEQGTAIPVVQHQTFQQITWFAGHPDTAQLHRTSPSLVQRVAPCEGESNFEFQSRCIKNQGSPGCKHLPTLVADFLLRF